MEWEKAADFFTEALASSNPTPGGGAAAAQTGAMGAALLLMAIRTTLKRKNLTQEQLTVLQTGENRINDEKKWLSCCIHNDSEAYERYLWAKRLPADNFTRKSEIQNAIEQAALVPAKTAQHALNVLKELKTLRPFIAPIILSDAVCAKHLLQASICCAVENIRANIPFIQNKELVEKLDKQIQFFLESSEEGNYE
jgi:formiminotetrahydrofolate cyclodeaminase